MREKPLNPVYRVSRGTNIPLYRKTLDKPARWNLARAKDFLACIQSLAIIISLPVGAYWAIATLTKERALLALETERLALEKTLDALRSRPVNVKINAKQIIQPHDSAKHLSVLIETTNTGPKTVSFFWTDCKFTVARVLLSDCDHGTLVPCLAKQVDPPRQGNLEIIMSPGETESALFLASVEQPGLYLLTVEIKPFQQGETKPTLVGSNSPEYWAARAHLIVE